jgi:hypothetical protein
MKKSKSLAPPYKGAELSYRLAGYLAFQEIKLEKYYRSPYFALMNGWSDNDNGHAWGSGRDAIRSFMARMRDAPFPKRPARKR